MLSAAWPWLGPVLAALAVGPAAAEPPARWGLCAAPAAPADTAPASETARRQAPLDIDAERLEATLGETSEFTGDAVLERADQRLEANYLRYDQRTERVYGRDDVHYREPNLRVHGSEVRWELTTDQGWIDATGYELPQRHAHGASDTIELLGGGRTRLTDVSYTTCDPGDRDWALVASEIELDREAGKGTAKHVRVHVKDVPVFYTPYASFPLDDRRKSGFLVPSFGSSSSSGTDIRVPYYWNIAPNQDATIAPRYLGDRGTLLGTEYRYLTPAMRGRLYVEYLPNDALYGDDRGLVEYEHKSKLTPNWRLDVEASDVSDGAYFEDLGNSLSQSSQTHLLRRATTRYDAGPWDAIARVEDYQTVDPDIAPTSRPYRRLPQFLVELNRTTGPLGLDYALDSEAVRFDREASVTGTRLDLYPQVMRRFGTPGYYLEPKLGLHYTAYDLANVGPGGDSTPTRALPVASLDGGVFLERVTSFADRSFLHTLEPRLFYLYVPYEDQSDLIIDPDGDSIVFDSGTRGLSVDRLFSERRFSGRDRVGDANQLSAAVTTRLIEQRTGRTWLTARIGQILYLRDREVTLPGRPPETDNTSPVVADVDINLGEDWSVDGEAHWNPHTDVTEKGTLQLHYEAADDQIFNLAYRRRAPNLEQTDLSFIWPLGARWQAVGRWNYSLEDSRTLEAFAGVGYESCCWAARVVGRRYIISSATSENQILFQVELKGLTSVGQEVGALLERGILGYSE